MNDLREYLISLQPGPLADTAKLESVLAPSWDQFDGSNAEGMEGDKLHQRMADVVWTPPMLRFTIDRHGGTVSGSTRAERQEWTLDTQTMRARFRSIGHTQLKPMQQKWPVRPVAEEVVALILNHQSDNRLKWSDDGSVRVHIGKILPKDSAFKSTLINRRKRFRQMVGDLLALQGWAPIGPNRYRPPQAE
jgi:hypothetical protein